MNSPSRIAEEFIDFRSREFWKIYSERLNTHLGSRMDKLRNDPIEKIQYVQGEVKSLEWVKNLPDAILADLALKSKQGD